MIKKYQRGEVKRHLKKKLTYLTPHKEEPRNDIQAFTNYEFLFFGSILGGYGGHFILNSNGARANTIAIQKYNKNFGQVLGRPGTLSGRRGGVTEHAGGEEGENFGVISLL